LANCKPVHLPRRRTLRLPAPSPPLPALPPAAWLFFLVGTKRTAFLEHHRAARIRCRNTAALLACLRAHPSLRHGRASGIQLNPVVGRWTGQKVGRRAVTAAANARQAAKLLPLTRGRRAHRKNIEDLSPWKEDMHSQGLTLLYTQTHCDKADIHWQNMRLTPCLCLLLFLSGRPHGDAQHDFQHLSMYYSACALRILQRAAAWGGFRLPGACQHNGATAHGHWGRRRTNYRAARRTG